MRCSRIRQSVRNQLITAAGRGCLGWMETATGGAAKTTTRVSMEPTSIRHFPAGSPAPGLAQSRRAAAHPARDQRGGAAAGAGSGGERGHTRRGVLAGRLGNSLSGAGGRRRAAPVRPRAVPGARPRWAVASAAAPGAGGGDAAGRWPGGRAERPGRGIGDRRRRLGPGIAAGDGRLGAAARLFRPARRRPFAGPGRSPAGGAECADPAAFPGSTR